MIPSGPSTPVGGDPSANPSVLRTNSGQAGFVPSQSPFSSLVSPRNQFNNSNNMGFLGNLSNVNSILNSSFGNGGPGSITGLGNSHVNGLQQRGGMGGMDMGRSAEPGPLSFASSSGQAQGHTFGNPAANQMGSDHNLAQQVEASQNFQQQFSVPQSQQQKLRGGPGMSQGPSVKMESQTSVPDQMGSQSQLPSLRNLGSVKLEPQQLQAMRNLGPVKLEGNQHSADPSIFLHQQQQQQQHQQLLQLSRQSSQAAAHMNLMQQQRLLQMQQQQQLLKTLPQQRSQFQQQQQQQQQQPQQPQQPQQGLTMRPQARPSVFEPGVCARRLTHYMYKQQHRPADNNIDFWRKFVSEFFAPRAKKRWCVSLYGSGRQTSGVFPQDVWHCEICNRKPGRGFETTVEVLPRLCKIKYDSGTLEELLYVDMPHEYQTASGQIVLDYAKAIQESVFEQLRVVRDGQLRVVFNSDLKICSWEFCARRHEELIPRRLIVPQVSQLGAVAREYQSTAQNTSSTSNLSPQDLQTTCNSFVASARQLAKSLEVPLVNDLGYTKRYVRCLQISEVVNSMKDLIDYSRETGTGPMASLVNFPRTPSGPTMSQLAQHSEEQQTRGQSSIHNDQNSGLTSVQHNSLSNGVLSANKSMNPASSTASATAIVGLLHQNSMNSRQENSINNMSSPYIGGNAVQIPSASSSSAPPQSQPNGPNPSSPFPSPTPSATNNGPQVSRNDPSLSTGSMPTNMSVMQQTANQSNDTDMGDPQSSVHQLIQEMMMSSQMNGGGSVGNNIKEINGMTQTLPGGNCMPTNGISNHSSIGSMGYGSMGGVGPGATTSGIRTAMMNNSMALTGRGGINQLGQETSTINHQQQQNYGNRLLNGFGRANSFNNLNFDWKNTP